MNGRLSKVDMYARVNKIITGIHSKQWYPEWNWEQRNAAKRALINVLEVLDEYHT